MLTDNDSAMMFSSYGLVQGYYGQAPVDSKNQVIVHLEAFGSADDEHYIIPHGKIRCFLPRYPGDGSPLGFR